MGDQMMLLGARIAEIEALYACALEETDPRAERRLLAELAEAGVRLAKETGAAVPRPREGGRPRLRRRIVRTQRTADWIIARTTRRTG
ncbi:hypothetical protein [Actinomadura rubrisoli]|uniref:hypothetical protein n=1 Tax=Actinomadura rubrisoli TaxID=2530368 RepID=UPI001404EE42|nr:hypothetical protein [Actinomadura rubrisoli]